jgi:hypothetical protein
LKFNIFKGYLMRNRGDAPNAWQGVGADGKSQNRHHESNSLGTLACHCGIGARRVFTCITCARFSRYMGQVEDRMTARGAA